MFFEGQSLKLYAAHMVVRMNMETALPHHPVLKNIKGAIKAETIKGGQSFVIQGKASWKSDVEQYLVRSRHYRYVIKLYYLVSLHRYCPHDPWSVRYSLEKSYLKY